MYDKLKFLVLVLALMMPLSALAYDASHTGAQTEAEITRCIGRNTAVGDPGSDDELVTEQAVREALDEKADVASPTFIGKMTTEASDTSEAGINIPHGTAPTSPSNGDVWTTTSGIYAYIDGEVVGPLGASAVPDDLTLGTDDTTAGSLDIYGADTITPGVISIYNPADDDDGANYWRFTPNGDTLWIGPDDDTDMFRCNTSGEFYAYQFLGDGQELTIDASGFSGNLTTDDNTLQEIAVALDGLSVGVADDSLLEVKLDSTNSPTDNYILSYDDGTGGFTWVAPGAGSGDLLANGTVPLTADWDVGSYKITAEQFESDIAIGTAPFIVTSTTVVTNLNADLLDGESASAFQDQDSALDAIINDGGIDPDTIVGDDDDNDLIDQDIIEGFGASATPKMTLDDSDGADGYIDVNAADADDAVMTIGVDDSGGDDQTYIELDGVNETVEIKKPLETSSSIELGNASDTTLARSAAGTVTIEGNTISTDSDQDRWQSVGIAVAGMIADGTNCTDPDSEAINSGPNMWFSTCSDTAGTLEFSIPMPENWDGGNIYFELVAGSNEATPSGTVEFEIQAMARGNDDLINSTWLSTVNLQFGSNIDTQYDVVTAESAVIACSGAGGDMLYIKATRDNDDGTNDTSTQDVEIWGARVYYQIDDLDERD